MIAGGGKIVKPPGGLGQTVSYGWEVRGGVLGESRDEDEDEVESRGEEEEEGERDRQRKKKRDRKVDAETNVEPKTDNRPEAALCLSSWMPQFTWYFPIWVSFACLGIALIPWSSTPRNTFDAALEFIPLCWVG